MQTSFLPFTKSVTEKKTTKRGLCGSRQKDRASHEVRMVGIYFVNPGCAWLRLAALGCAWQSLNEFSSALAGTGFLPAGDCPAELPVMN